MRSPIVAARLRLAVVPLVATALAASAIALGPAAAPAQGVTPAPSVSSVHPRIMASEADFIRLKSQVSKDGTSSALYKAIKSEADADLTSPALTYSKPDGIRLIAMSETMLKHAQALGMMYHLTGSSTYKNRLWKDLDTVSKFPDWNPDEYLDTAEMTTGVAIGYDWLYNDLSSAQRTELATAITKKGLAPSLAVYNAPANTGGPYKYGGNWSQQNGNWNIVVNSGMAIGAMAVTDVPADSSTAKTVLADAMNSIQKGVASYANGGGWSEGLGYWEYATRYFTMFVQTLESATGSDRGFLSKPGVADTGYFPLYMSSNDGGTTFAFGDSAVAPYMSSAVGALGKLLKNTTLETAGDVPNEYGSNVQRLLSVVPGAAKTSPAAAKLPLDRSFANAAAATFRSSWTDPNGTFVGFRTGTTPTAAHQNLDAGSFSLGALGQTWAEELGKDDYNLPGYFDSTADGQRWTYYRERAEGQNTLVIDPTDPDALSATAKVPAATVTANGANGQSVANLSALYAGDVTSWKRGIKTFDGGTETVVQDEVTSSKPFEALWTMHTTADIRISDDGRTALLYLGGREMAARITRGAGVFTQTSSAPLPTSPAPSQASNPGMNDLQIDLRSPGSTALAVEFTPVVDPSAALPAAAPVTALASWKPDASVSAGETPVSSVTAPSAGDVLSAAKLSGQVSSLSLGGSETLTSTGILASGHTDTAAVARYVTSDPSVASISAYGVVKALAPGTVRVGAILTDGSYTASAGSTLTVIDPYAVHALTDADTYVQGGTTAKENFGTSTKLAVKPHRKGQVATNLTRTAYLHFSLPTVKGHKVTSAVISIPGLVSDANGSKVEVDAHVVTGSWGEKTLTYANQPAIGGTIGHAVYTSTLATQKFDITKYINASSFSGTLSIALTEDAPPNGQPLFVAMTSRESKTPPTIDVEIAH